MIALIEAARAAKGIVPRAFTADEIMDRLLKAMVEEGRALLAEGIAARSSDIDLVMINGYGFPHTGAGRCLPPGRMNNSGRHSAGFSSDLVTFEIRPRHHAGKAVLAVEHGQAAQVQGLHVAENVGGVVVVIAIGDVGRHDVGDLGGFGIQAGRKVRRWPNLTASVAVYTFEQA